MKNKPITITINIGGETSNRDIGEYILSYFEVLITEEKNDNLNKNEEKKLDNFRKFFINFINDINNTDSSKLKKLFT